MKVSKLFRYILLSLIILLLGVILALLLGANQVTMNDIYQSVFHNDNSIVHITLRDVRLPRVIAVLMTGGILGSTGAMMQGITRNPIAEPSLLGINQGATLVIAIFFALNISITTKNVFIASLIGALISGVIVLGLLFKTKDQSITKILLAGTAISTFFISLTTIIGLLANQSQFVAFWVSGGFRNTTWMDALLVTVGGGLCLTLGLLLAKKLNILNLGDDVAIGLGVNPRVIRLLVLMIIIPSLAIAVAVGKNIAFVGLIVPQITRKLFKDDYIVNIFTSFIFGAILLTYSDILARLIYSPYEVPIGIFTALIGVPFFIYMAKKEIR